MSHMVGKVEVSRMSSPRGGSSSVPFLCETTDLGYARESLVPMFLFLQRHQVG